MSRRDKVVTLAVVGGVVILLGVLTRGWWSIEGDAVGMGLRSAKICAGGFGCATISYDSPAIPIAELSAADAAVFRYATSTFWVGILAAALLFAHAWTIRTHPDRRGVGYAAGAVCGAVVVLAIATAASFPDELADVASRGWSFYATLVGCLLGAGSAIPRLIPTSAVAGARDAVGDLGNRVHRAALGPLADLEKDDKVDPKSVPKARIHKD